MEKYDILVIQKVAIDRRTGRAYCPSLSKYMVVYSSGRAAIYVHRRWDIKTVEAKGGEDWAQVTIGEGAILVKDFNTHYPL
jgi:hypothetical protein